MKVEEQEDNIYRQIESYLNRKSKEVFSAIASLVTVIASLVATFIDASQLFEVAGTNRKQVLLSLVVTAIVLFIFLFFFQLILIKKKKNAKIEKFKSNLIDKYIAAVEQSFVNPKNN